MYGRGGKEGAEKRNREMESLRRSASHAFALFSSPSRHGSPSQDHVPPPPRQQNSPSPPPDSSSSSSPPPLSSSLPPLSPRAPPAVPAVPIRPPPDPNLSSSSPWTMHAMETNGNGNCFLHAKYGMPRMVGGEYFSPDATAVKALYYLFLASYICQPSTISSDIATVCQ